MSDPTRGPQPRWRPVLSVRVRILASILLAAGIGLAASGLAAYVVQRERTLSEVDASLTAVVDETRFIACSTSGCRA